MKSEHKELTEYKKELNSILKSKSKQSKILKEEFDESLDVFKKIQNFSERRTSINDSYKELDYSIDEFESKEPITVILSKNAWIKSIKGHQHDYTGVKYKDGDRQKFDDE